MGDAKDSVACGVRRRDRIVNNARSVATRRSRVAWVLSEDVEHIAEVETDSAHAQQRMRLITLQGGLRIEEEVADCSARVEVQAHEAPTRELESEHL